MPGSKHLSITGTKHGATQLQLHRATLTLQQKYDEGFRWLHHGRCKGADVEVAAIAQRLGFKTIGHPGTTKAWQADDFVDYYTRDFKPNLERNHDIVDEGEYLLALPRGGVEELRSGTWATIRYARKLGRPMGIIKPNGDWL